MACLCRIRQTRVNHLFSQLKRSYFQVSPPCLSDYVAQNKIPSSLNNQQILGVLGRSKGVFDIVRFFAAPVQSKKKEETKMSKGPRLNEQIKSHMVRLVNDEGHEILPFHVAMERAKSLNQDLVEVDCNAKPIVCKIMDYHRERYQQQLKEKERFKSKAEISVRKGACKEVRFSPKIEQKDLQMKADMAKRLMERGYRVKCMVIGSEDQDLRGLIDRLHSLIEEVAFVESGPRVEKSQAYVLVRHIKFGPSKKGGKGAAAKSADTASLGRQKDTASRSTGGPVQHPANLDARGLENDYDESSSGDSDSQSTREQHKRKWSLSDHKKKPPVPPNSSENRYSRRQEDSTRLMMRPGPVGAQIQMPRLPNSSENRYSRQSFIPKQNHPNSSDCIPPSTSYGVFSSSHNHQFGFAKTQGPATIERAKPDADSSTGSSTHNQNICMGLFSGEGSNANASRTFQNQSKVER